MNRPALFFLALALASCSTTRTPPPAPVLLLERLDAVNVSAGLTPPPVSGYWRLHLSAECGASDGPATGGEWPASGRVVVMAGRGDLFTAVISTREGRQVTVSDCVPEVAWNQAD